MAIMIHINTSLYYLLIVLIGLGCNNSKQTLEENQIDLNKFVFYEDLVSEIDSLACLEHIISFSFQVVV